ncbi:MAG: hypothetical protein IGR76_04570 [Synechococcales cyanobacterium T60_A2020_003]|nr:hypothetical protein [Synechococcales cyanobacterium T60_A2020_003]
MAKPTQAHMSKRVRKTDPPALKDRTKTQMEYYMGAKLIEVGVNPKSAIYRWSIEDKGSEELWIYSAYWADSKDRILAEEQTSQSDA